MSSWSPATSRTAEGARFLLERGVNGIKVGIGPGGGCTTRLNTNFGVPQVQALVECRAAAGGRVPLIADGGVKRDGALVQALLFGGDTVMLGSAFAGTAETPGEVVQKSVARSRVAEDGEGAVQGVARDGVDRGHRDRLDVEDAEAVDLEALGAEGMEVSVPARGSVRPILRDMHQAPLLGDQLRRRAQPRRAAGDVPEESGALRDQADRVEPARVVRPLSKTFQRAEGHRVTERLTLACETRRQARAGRTI